MNEDNAKVSVPIKKRRLSTNEFCFICNTASSEIFVLNPQNDTWEKLVSCLNKRAIWGDEKIKELKKKFHNFTVDNLRSKNVKWHRNCYAVITNKDVCDKLEKQFNSKSQEEREGTESHAYSPQENPPTPPRKVVTRAQVPTYDKSNCFFCDKPGDPKDKLRKVATDKAGKHLHQAVKFSQNEVFRVRLAEAGNPDDAHAIDVMYHKNCWQEHVLNVLRRYSPAETDSSKKSDFPHSVSKIEFIDLLGDALRAGNIFSMRDIEEKYREICSSHKVQEDMLMNRRILKMFIKTELSGDGVEFSQPKRMNETERVSVKITRDKLTQIAETEGEGLDKNNRILFQAAKILRDKVLKQKSWNFDGSFPENTKEIVPEEVITFFKWSIKGDTNIFTETESIRSKDLEKRSEVLSQIFVTSCLTRRQAKKKMDTNVRSVRETPLNIGLGLYIHNSTRDKSLIELLHKLGLSIGYAKVLRLETQIASGVIQNMQRNSGVYIPSDIISGKFIHCAADNIDFQEDTVDGKRTLHGTVMSIYQVKDENAPVSSLTLGKSYNRSLENYADVIPYVATFRKPLSWTTCCPEPTKFSDLPCGETKINESRLLNLAWNLHRKSTILTKDEDQSSLPIEHSEADQKTRNVLKTPSLTWAGYMASFVDLRPTFLVSTLPIIPLSPTDHAVQLTFMRRFEEINNIVLGAEKRVVVTVDMALYKPLKQIEMSDKQCQQKWILKPGELHIIIAMLRTIGDFIQNSGIPDLWVDSELYGTATVRQILAGKHIRRGLDAHGTTFSAFSMMLFDEFTEQENITELVDSKISCFNDALKEGESVKLKECNRALVDALKSSEIFTKLSKFCDERASNEPVFEFAMTYMEMVEIMLLFLKAVRSGDWLLSLAALRKFVKYFFAFDRQNYARMISLYLAEMNSLEETEPDIWAQFMRGNWVVNKSQIPFSALGADEALEHENRRLKVQGGLTGLTLNEAARTRLFLADVELTRISSKLEKFANLKSYEVSHHHSMSLIVRGRQDKNVLLLKAAFETTTHPFSCRNQNLIQLVTKQVFQKDIQHDVKRVKSVGEEMFLKFVAERIETKTVPFWSPLKKLQLKTCKSATKKARIGIKGKIVEIKEDTALLSRLIIASRSRQDIDMKSCISNYELSSVPKSLFTAAGSMHHCLAKYKLAEVLEALPPAITDPDGDLLDQNPSTSTSTKVAIVDGMALLHTLSKPSTVKTCDQLAEHFYKVTCERFAFYEELHLVFDSYREGSLKEAIRNHRQSNSGRSQYKILPTTNISNTSMKKLLSHENTKDELTDFLSKYLIKHASEHKRKVIVSWRTTAKASHKCVQMLACNHEEADTKIILHGKYVAENGCDILHIFSPDTDVLILALRRYLLLPPDTGIFLGVGMRRFVSLKPIFDSLGPLKASALPGLHALSGCDTTGSFANKGKPTWWKSFQNCHHEVLEALVNLGKSPILSDEMLTVLEGFICQVYVPKTSIKDIGEARWYIFTKKNQYDDHLPPTRSALIPALKRANYQAMVWQQDIKPLQDLPSPIDHGWKKFDDCFEPILSTELTAPEFLLDMIKCSCKVSKCSQNCGCRAHGLPCTEMCVCNGDETLCTNSSNVESEDEHIDFSSDEED